MFYIHVKQKRKFTMVLDCTTIDVFIYIIIYQQVAYLIQLLFLLEI